MQLCLLHNTVKAQNGLFSLNKRCGRMQSSLTLMLNQFVTGLVKIQCLQAPAYLQWLLPVTYELCHILLAAGFSLYFLIHLRTITLKSELTTTCRFSFDQDKGTVCGSQRNNGLRQWGIALTWVPHDRFLTDTTGKWNIFVYSRGRFHMERNCFHCQCLSGCRCAVVAQGEE